MNVSIFAKTLVGIADIDAFWSAREKIKKSPLFGDFLGKIIRRRYGAGIPALEGIRRFNALHGFYGIFISKMQSL